MTRQNRCSQHEQQITPHKTNCALKNVKRYIIKNRNISTYSCNISSNWRDNTTEYLISVSWKSFFLGSPSKIHCACYALLAEIKTEIIGKPANECCKGLLLNKSLVSPNGSSILLQLFRKYSVFVSHRNQVSFLWTEKTKPWQVRTKFPAKEESLLFQNSRSRCPWISEYM